MGANKKESIKRYNFDYYKYILHENDMDRLGIMRMYEIGELANPNIFSQVHNTLTRLDEDSLNYIKLALNEHSA